MRRLPSASSLERAFACPPSQVYPQLRASGEAIWTRRGTVIHRFLERVGAVGFERALEEVPVEFQEACACIEVEKLPAFDAGAYAFEVAFAYNLANDTARELCRGLGREEAYALAAPHELVGTMDVLGLTDDAVVVCDYKTGYRYFNAIEENAQLMFYALAACRALGRKRAMMAIIRINQEGRPFFIWGEVGEAELDAFAHSLRELDDNIADLSLIHVGGEELHPVTGDHCQYCPAVHRCPAWMALARSMTSPEDDKGGLPELTMDTAPLFIEAVKRGKKVLERIEKGLQLFAEQTPINLEGGWVYGKHPFPNRDWDVGKALPILQRYLGDDAASTVAAEVVEKQIRELFKQMKAKDPKGPIRNIDKETKEVMRHLEVEGALTIRYSFPVGRHRPKPEDAEILAAAGFKTLTEGEATNGEAGQEKAGDAHGDAAGEAA